MSITVQSPLQRGLRLLSEPDESSYPSGNFNTGKKESEKTLQTENKLNINKPQEKSTWDKFLKALIQALGVPHT